jgi:hypothetical protein
METKKVIMTELLRYKLVFTCIYLYYKIIQLNLKRVCCVCETCEFRGFSCQFRKLTEVGVVKGVVKRSEA